MNFDGLEGFARSALALALVASYKIGSGSGSHRSRRKVAHRARTRPKNTREANALGSPPHPGPLSGESPKLGRERRRAWLRDVATAFWITLLLFTLIYAAMRGESGLVDLDEVRLLVDF